MQRKLHIVPPREKPVIGQNVTQAQYQSLLKNDKKTRTINNLIFQLHALGLPTPEREIQPLLPRKWQADLLWQDARLVVEYEGGVTSHLQEMDLETGKLKQSRHLTAKGFRNDCEKYNALQIAGFVVLRAEVVMVDNGLAAQQIAEAYYARIAQVEIEFALAMRAAIHRFGPRRMASALHTVAFHDGGDLA